MRTLSSCLAKIFGYIEKETSAVIKGDAPNKGLDKQGSTERVNATKSVGLKCIVSVYGPGVPRGEISTGCGSFEVLWLLLGGITSIYNAVNPLYIKIRNTTTRTL